MSALRKLASQTAIYGVSSIVGRLMNYLLVPLYTRVFDEDAYGVVTELYAYVAFLIVLLTYGMETAFFRFASSEKDVDKRRQIFSTAFISVAIAAITFLVIVLFGLDGISASMGYEAHSEYILYFALIIALDVMVTIPFARLRLENKPIPFVAVNLGTILTNIALNLFFLLYCPAALENPDALGHDIISSFYNPAIGIGYIFISNLVSSALKFVLLSPWMAHVKSGWNKEIFNRLIPYSLPLLVLGLAGIVNETFDRAFFADLSGLPDMEAKAQLGIYGACYKVAMLLSIGIQAYRFAAEPFVFALEKTSAGNNTQADIMKYYFIVALFISLVILCFLDTVLLMVGEKFREGRDVIPILLVAYIFFGAVFNLSFWYKLNDKTRYGALIAISGAVVTIAMNVWLVPKIGYMGSAWATLVAYTVMMVLSFYLGKKHFPIEYNLLAIGSYAFLATILYAAHRFMDLGAPYSYISGGVAVLLFIMFIVNQEKKLFEKLKSIGSRNHK
jgi:O-antigen/teichoic acid export membrane protein